MKFILKSVKYIEISELETGEPLLILDLSDKDLSIPLEVDTKNYSINGAVIDIDDVLYRCHIKGLAKQEE